MNNIEEMIAEFQSVSNYPEKQLKKYISEGKKVIGCMPYFCPEELIYSTGMIPFGLWGTEIQASESKRYLPVFICSLQHTILELGILGKYDGLTAVMIPMLCDSLKGMAANWQYGVKSIPTISVAHAQNRKKQSGVNFTASQYRKILNQLEELSGNKVSDSDIALAIEKTNNHRAVMRRFLDVSQKLSPSKRNAVIKSSYFMDASEHAKKVEALTSALKEKSTPEQCGVRIVTSGIIADDTNLLRILDEYNITIVSDQVTHESLRFRTDVPVTEDPIIGLAQQIGLIEGCPVLFDPEKQRGQMLVELAKQNDADGVLIVQTKFCDPEEYDFVPIKKMLDREGISNLLVEVDQQTRNNEQLRTVIETFVDIISS